MRVPIPMLRLLLSGALVCALGSCGTEPEPLVLTTAYCHGVADGTPCDDGSPCTAADRCGLGVCRGDPVNEGESCDDENACTVGDQCGAGACVGIPLSCTSKDSECARGVCDADSGTCVGEPRNEGLECADGSKCTLGDRCKKGACLGAPMVCEDLTRPCMDGKCNEVSGQCVFKPKDESAGPPNCDDHDLCTTDDICQSGACVGTVTDCGSLASPCKKGVCNPGSGLCEVQADGNGTLCSDGNACTDGETCSGGACGGGVQVPNGGLCDDGDVCTTADVCTSGACFGVPKDCTAAAGKCETPQCVAGTGQCVAVPVTGVPACFCHDKDDGVPCTDGDPCTTNDACLAKACVSVAVDCAGAADACNTAVCHPGTGACLKVPVQNGLPCDDQLICTVYDHCQGGTCSGQKADCSSLGSTCTISECDEKLGGCVVSPAPSLAPCDDADVCTGHDACDNGLCAGTTDLCAACAGKAPGQACNDGDACTSKTTCQLVGKSLVCLGEPKDCGYAGGVCTVGVCELGTGECVAVPATKGAPCDDGDVCTHNDGCAAGKCAGELLDCSALDGVCRAGACSPLTGKCQVKLFDDGFVCNDQNPCTVADQCNAGECTGKVAKDGTPCDDGVPCTVGETCTAAVCGGWPKDCSAESKMCLAGVCDPTTGNCTTAPLTEGTPCNDLDVCTLKDGCQSGVCLGAINACLCQEQPDGATCDDGQKCTDDDACTSGGCVGIPHDCSAIGSPSGCRLGQCDAASGACVLVDAFDGVPCDDGDGCTVVDSCDSGVCVGIPKNCSNKNGLCVVGTCVGGSCYGLPATNGTACEDGDSCTAAETCQLGACVGGNNLCGPCLGKAVGDACDDGNACTEGQDLCVKQGALLVCAGGSVKDCAFLDAVCVVGTCTAAGVCQSMPRTNGTPCDDQAPCTASDACQGGVCTGTPIDMCGASVASCESPTANDQASQAVTLPLAAGQTAVLGWIAPAGETDWYAITLAAGQLLTVETAPHCGSALDTQVGVYSGDGKSLVASADAGGADGFAKLVDVPVTTNGTYLVGVTAFLQSGANSYVLRIDAHEPPPCTTDAQCGCAEKKCSLGKCVPATTSVELEPNDTPGTASGVVVGGSALGALGGPGDSDWYVVALMKAVPVTVHTSSYCGSQTDPVLAIYDATGVTLLAGDADGAGGGHAQVAQLAVPGDGLYRIRVTDQQLGQGAYVLHVDDARCHGDAECACEDEVCDGTVALPGQCVAALKAVESAVPVEVIVGDRVSAELEVPYDADEFQLLLGPGTYDVETLSYCASDTDTEIVLVGPDGKPVASDADSGDSFFARLSGVVVSSPGTYVIYVTGYGPSTGSYVVRVQPSGL